MEGDAGTAGGGGGGDGGGGSEGVKNPPEGKIKVKRKMKTASQLEILENTYAVETYPSESMRAELSIKLELSDRQLQTWFRQRRLKDRKAPPVKPERKEDTSSPANVALVVGEEKGHCDNVSGSGLFAHTDSQRAGVAGFPRIGPKRKRAISELKAFDLVEVQLGEPLREDGPILGMEFDPLPPGAFGAPIAPVGEQKSAGRSNDANLYERSVTKNVKVPPRTVHEYQFLPEQPSIKSETYERAQSSSSRYFGSPIDRSSQHGSELVSSGYGFHSPLPSLSLIPHHDRQHSGEYDVLPRKSSLSIAGMDADENVAQIERRRKIEEARIAKEAEVQEKRIRKELEKQEILRRKNEEHMKKEMERQERERRKDEERLLREKLREEERYQREQRREMERREKLMHNESQRAEKMKLKEELRREKELARLKVASDRATARRMAKESTELIDDERLELLELVALSRGLPSILSLDSETIENLEFLRDKLPAFPPQSVHMKKPFAVQPWTDSEENIGNLLMVWRFLITFADVLGLWPFTLDEFVQAFHDYESRLLGEIHISLLRSIIKDVEDVARTPATGFGSNQNNTANLGGGHPHIVEGAYEWGFDIRSWKHHLNPLTWPEILRQFALSAGFGPKLKKRTTESSFHQDESEDNNSEDVIYKLRTGVAAQNAFAKMQERGFANPKRSRHRLTPGTVKFAAFHVLSLEGSKGLAILEVADRIQKFGLRNLTTSRTPEASVAAALSRDTKLFERTAPSTYCVRSPYRKDPIDADMILSAAREKIQMFTNGYFDGEEADDVEPDKDSESDVAEDPDADESETTGNKARFDIKNPSGIKTPESGPKDEKTVGQSVVVTETCLGEEVHLVQDDNTVIDESTPGETWVHGLTQGEYSDLSVLERLNALVSLISVANEGNSVRAVLEERLEAANSLKKQMWAEAQLDKRRIKEEFVAKIQYSSFSASKVEQNHLVIAAENEHAHDLPNNMNILSVERNPLPQATDFLTNTNNISLQHTGFAAEKSQLQLKADIGHKAEEMYVYRSLPLGQDRRRNRYWQFVTSASQNDPGSGRLFIELQDGSWRLIDSEEDFDSLLACLDLRGIRESHLHSMLQKIEGSFKESGRKKTKVKENALRRYQEFEKWTCEECTNPSLLRATKSTDVEKKRKQLLGVCNECMELYLFEDNHCPSCHLTFTSSVNDIKFTEHTMKCSKEDNPNWDLVNKWKSTPLLKNTLLKVLLASIEMSVPTEALQPAWLCDYRNSCGMKLLSASSTEDILKILTQVEGAIRRDSLSSCYQTTNELLGCGETIFSHPETISILPWIPPTTSAVALRLMELDASILYVPGQPVDSHKDYKMAFPSRFVLAKNIPQDNGVDHLADPKIHGKGRWRGHPRGGRSKRKSKSEAAARRRRSTKTDRFGQMLGLKGKAGNGRRSLKGGPTTSTTMIKKVGDISSHKNIIQPQETIGIQPKTSLECWDYNNDYNGQATTGDELLVANGYESINGIPDPLGGHDLKCANNIEIEEDERIERDGFENHAVDSDEDDDDGQGDNDVERYINDDSDNENRDDDYRQQTNNMDENKEVILTSSSSDYSDE